MKKTTLLRVLSVMSLLVLLFSFASCKNESIKETESGSGENVPSEKKIYLPYTMLDHSESCKYTYYYDEYGNEIKRTKEDLNGNLQATWICEYDGNHNLTKKSVDSGNGTLFVQLIQTYNDKGNLLEKREISTAGEEVYTYRYDEQNRLASVIHGGEVIETYTYEADGSYRLQNTLNSDEYSLYDSEGRIKERSISSKLKLVYSYNSNGVLTECDTYSGEDITKKTVYSLDENGNAVKVTQVSASGTETVLSEYEYKEYTVKAKK